MQMIAPETLLGANLLNEESGVEVIWTRVNVGEATPGTVTPLTAEFQRPANRFPAGRMYHRMGLLGQPVTPKFGGAHMCSFLCGKMAVNVDVLRWLMDRTPGSSGDQFEASILGSVREGVTSKPQRVRYPIALVKLVWLIYKLPSENKTLGKETYGWWQQCIQDLKSANAAEARSIFSEARDRYERILDHAGLVASFSPAIMSQLSRPVEKLGTKEDVLNVASGFGTVKETEMLESLWSVAKGKQSLKGFLNEYGYMCPSGANLESKSWRENPDTLAPIIDINCDADEDESPKARLAKRSIVAEQTRHRLFAAASFLQKFELRIGLWLARRILPIREVGKSCMFMAPDVARAAARIIGADLAEKSVIKSGEDVFYLSFDELMSQTLDGSDTRTVIAERKKLHSHYKQIDLPDFFSSEELKKIIWAYVKRIRSPVVDEPALNQAQPDLPQTIHAVPASSGKFTGVAKVIRDPSELDRFKKDDVLVCEVTDPGWAAFFSVAGALVADVGGMLSHSAIVAREIGIPAIVNTRIGTKTIPDGAVVTVDGGAGTITIHGNEIASTNSTNLPEVDSAGIVP